jgi:4-hydroxy-tetrahydrodipicolinate synthase
MANFHPELYVWLCENWEREPAEASRLQDFLSVASLAERVMYPMSAKYHQSLEGIGIRLATRRMDVRNFDYAARLGIEQLRRTAREWNSRLGLQPGLAD